MANTRKNNPTCCICGKKCENEWGNNPRGFFYTVMGESSTEHMDVKLLDGTTRTSTNAGCIAGTTMYSIEFQDQDVCCDECNRHVIECRFSYAC